MESHPVPSPNHNLFYRIASPSVRTCTENVLNSMDSRLPFEPFHSLAFPHTSRMTSTPTVLLPYITMQ